MQPFCWVGRVMNGAFSKDSLAIYVWLRQPIDKLAAPVRKALPTPLAEHLVAGRLVCVGIRNKIKAQLKQHYGLAKTPKPALVPEPHATSTNEIMARWSKAAPWDRFIVSAEAWLALLHEHHPIAIAAIDWYPWHGQHARPEPSPWHTASIRALPDEALAAIADEIDDEQTGESSARRDLVTAVLYYASDSRSLYDRVATDVALQKLFARAWAIGEEGRTLQLLATGVSDDTLAAVAAHTQRLDVLGRGLSVGDRWNVRAISTPSNAVWAVQERLRLFYLSRPMRPHISFDEQKGFLLREDDWGIDDVVDLPLSDDAIAQAFSSRYTLLVDGGAGPATAGDEKFIARCRSDIARVLTGTAADYKLRWV